MSFWKYDGPNERVYASIPVTVQPGDVIERDEVPAEDGYWSEVGAAGDGDRLVRADNWWLDPFVPDAMISPAATTEE